MRPEKQTQIELEADEKLLLLFQPMKIKWNLDLKNKIRFKW
jgi:hypothetical protein